MNERATVGAFDRVGAVWDGHSFDPALLQGYCRDALPGFAGPLDIAQFHGGASNPTFLLTDVGAGKRYVLRKKPPGDLLASAHAVDREYRVMNCLKDTAVPVPEMIAFCDDPAVLGTPFFLMPFIEGRIYRDNRLGDMSASDRTEAYRSVAVTLAALHSLDPASVGLADYGKPGNYFERQIARWTRQYREAQTESSASMERLIEELPDRIPDDDTTTLVHGDYRMENVMFAPAEPRIIAVLDWELSTLGHPLADLAFFCLFYHADFTRWGSAASIDFSATGIPDEAGFVAQYCAATGRDGIAGWNFYLAFSAFRLASIAQGVHKRALDGKAAPQDAGHHPKKWADLAARLLPE